MFLSLGYAQDIWKSTRYTLVMAARALMSRQSKLPSHLYIRIDRPLRAALVGAAEAQGVTISDLARRELRKVLAAEGRPALAATTTSSGGR